MVGTTSSALLSLSTSDHHRQYYQEEIQQQQQQQQIGEDVGRHQQTIEHHYCHSTTMVLPTNITTTTHQKDGEQSIEATVATSSAATTIVGDDDHVEGYDMIQDNNNLGLNNSDTGDNAYGDDKTKFSMMNVSIVTPVAGDLPPSSSSSSSPRSRKQGSPKRGVTTTTGTKTNSPSPVVTVRRSAGKYATTLMPPTTPPRAKDGASPSSSALRQQSPAVGQRVTPPASSGSPRRTTSSTTGSRGGRAPTTALSISTPRSHSVSPPRAQQKSLSPPSSPRRTVDNKLRLSSSAASFSRPSPPGSPPGSPRSAPGSPTRSPPRSPPRSPTPAFGKRDAASSEGGRGRRGTTPTRNMATTPPASPRSPPRPSSTTATRTTSPPRSSSARTSMTTSPPRSSTRATSPPRPLKASASTSSTSSSRMGSRGGGMVVTPVEEAFSGTRRHQQQHRTRPPVPATSTTSSYRHQTTTTTTILGHHPSMQPQLQYQPQQQLECDYDVAPTELYQAIEARQWDYVRGIFEDDQEEDDDEEEDDDYFDDEDDEEMDVNDEEEDCDENGSSGRRGKGAAAASRRRRRRRRLQNRQQAAVWVVRKETNGRLRWRLLPLHAAIIFQAPAYIIELLLTEHPAGAAAKDDQGMLPLHLAVRNKPIDWHVVEDLLTAHPAAVFVKDRKGRTPLQGGLAAAAAAANRYNLHHHHHGGGSGTGPVSSRDYDASAGSSGANGLGGGSFGGASLGAASFGAGSFAGASLASHTTGGGGVEQHRQHKATLQALDLYLSIYTAGEKTKWLSEYKITTERRIAGLAEQHAFRLTQLRDEFTREQGSLQEDHERIVRRLEVELRECSDREVKLAQVVRQLKEYVGEGHEEKQQERELRNQYLTKENKQLRRMVKALLEQQSALSASLDNLCQEQKDLHDRRNLLIHKYIEVNEAASATSQAHASVWKEQLEELHSDVYEKLAKMGKGENGDTEEDDEDEDDEDEEEGEQSAQDRRVPYDGELSDCHGGEEGDDDDVDDEDEDGDPDRADVSVDDTDDPLARITHGTSAPVEPTLSSTAGLTSVDEEDGVSSEEQDNNNDDTQCQREGASVEENGEGTRKPTSHASYQLSMEDIRGDITAAAHHALHPGMEEEEEEDGEPEQQSSMLAVADEDKGNNDNDDKGAKEGEEGGDAENERAIDSVLSGSSRQDPPGNQPYLDPEMEEGNREKNQANEMGDVQTPGEGAEKREDDVLGARSETEDDEEPRLSRDVVVVVEEETNHHENGENDDVGGLGSDAGGVDDDNNQSAEGYQGGDNDYMPERNGGEDGCDEDTEQKSGEVDNDHVRNANGVEGGNAEVAELGENSEDNDEVDVVEQTGGDGEDEEADDDDDSPEGKDDNDETLETGATTGGETMTDHDDSAEHDDDEGDFTTLTSTTEGKSVSTVLSLVTVGTNGRKMTPEEVAARIGAARNAAVSGSARSTETVPDTIPLTRVLSAPEEAKEKTLWDVASPMTPNMYVTYNSNSGAHQRLTADEIVAKIAARSFEQSSPRYYGYDVQAEQYQYPTGAGATYPPTYSTPAPTYTAAAAGPTYTTTTTTTTSSSARLTPEQMAAKIRASLSSEATWSTSPRVITNANDYANNDEKKDENDITGLPSPPTLSPRQQDTTTKMAEGTTSTMMVVDEMDGRVGQNIVTIKSNVSEATEKVTNKKNKSRSDPVAGKNVEGQVKTGGDDVLCMRSSISE